MKIQISTDKAPGAIGPYSQAIDAGASVYLWCDYSGGMVWRAEIHTEKRNEESWEMGDSSVRRTDSILCVSNGKVFSGRCSDELLLWKRGIPGVGESGMGCYHGKEGFECFTHQRSIVDKKTWMDLPIRYQKYRFWKEKMLRGFLR